MTYTPSKWQAEFHALTHDEALGAGAAGPGKTECLIMDPMAQVKVEFDRCSDPDHPYPLKWGNSKGWCLHMRRTRTMVEQTIERTHRIFPLMDPEASFDKTKSVWRFSSGYRYQFGHVKDPNDWQQYYSSEYTYIAYDELTQFLEEQYDQINTRCRTDDPVLRGMLKIRAMSNPVTIRPTGESFAMRDPHWVRRRFVEWEPEGRKTKSTKLVLPDGEEVKHRIIYLPATLYDNPNAAFVRDFAKQLSSKPAHIRNALLYGDWWVNAFSYYGEEWNPQIHTCDPFDIPDHWRRFRSMDWGFKAPGCVHWWAMDEDDNLYCEREYTFKGKTDIEVAGEIKKIEEKLGLWDGRRSSITGPADTQLWEKRGDSGKSKAETMLGLGVNWATADKRSRSRNAERVLARLKDHQNGMTVAGLVFFKNCKKAIQTLPGIQANPDVPEEPMDGGDDHWHDSICYAAAFASRGKAGIPKRRGHGDGGRGRSPASHGDYGYGAEA